MRTLRHGGHTVAAVTCDRRVIGVLALTDRPRPDAAAAVESARAVTGNTPVLLTGDNRAGADLTLRTADAVVVRDSLAAVPAVIALSRRARRVVVANLVLAATFIGVLVVWDLLGHLPLPLGVAGHEGSTILVALNGLRLLRDSAWERAARSG